MLKSKHIYTHTSPIPAHIQIIKDNRWWTWGELHVAMTWCQACVTQWPWPPACIHPSWLNPVWGQADVQSPDLILWEGRGTSVLTSNIFFCGRPEPGVQETQPVTRNILLSSHRLILEVQQLTPAHCVLLTYVYHLHFDRITAINRNSQVHTDRHSYPVQ